jgi:hypothetical protein
MTISTDKDWGFSLVLWQVIVGPCGGWTGRHVNQPTSAPANPAIFAATVKTTLLFVRYLVITIVIRT